MEAFRQKTDDFATALENIRATIQLHLTLNFDKRGKSMEILFTASVAYSHHRDDD